MNFLALMVFCSLITGECGLTATHPDDAEFFTTIEACKVEATKLEADVKRQEELLSESAFPGPWQTRVVCGTDKQAQQATALIVALNLRLKKEPEEPEHPGERDPAPNGG